MDWVNNMTDDSFDDIALGMSKAEEFLVDVYSIAGRIKNNARDHDAHLTPIGEGMCNLYAITLYDIYIFAKTLEEPSKTKLIDLLHAKEDFCRKVIELNKKKVVK